MSGHETPKGSRTRRHGQVTRREFLMATSAGTLASFVLASCGSAPAANPDEAQASRDAATPVPATSASAAATPVPATSASAVATSTDKAEVVYQAVGTVEELGSLKGWIEKFNASHPNILVTVRGIPPAEAEARTLTQLQSGSGPDIFGASESFLFKLIQNGLVADLTPYLRRPESLVKEDDFLEGMWGAARTRDGKIYGLPVACNPITMWYNRVVLREAGVTDMPADLYERGTWNWDAFIEMIETVRAKDKRGYVLGTWWAHRYSWVTTNGGKVYDNGRFVLHEDPKSVEAMRFVYDNVQNGNFTFATSLPQGQGDDALMLSNQVAFMGAGRWMRPTFLEAKLDADVAPWPSNTGEKIAPALMPAACYVMNAKTKYPEETYTFIEETVAPEGQIFNAQAGGDVPAIKGAEAPVLEADYPDHSKVFIDARNVGLALFQDEVSVPGLQQDIQDLFEPLWAKGGDLDATLKQIVETVNKKIQEARGG